VKHIFWIVCGALALLIVIAWFVVVPTAEAQASKQKLDQQAKDLKDLEKRAIAGNPPGVWDAENAAETERLAREFLITDRWKNTLQPHVEKYTKQLGDIRTQLLGRGAWLSKPIAPTSNVLEWYNAYIQASEALIANLRARGCMAAATPTEVVSAAGESPSTVRSVIGLYTKSGSFPDPKEHPLLTARLRVVEQLADRLIAARTAIADNPLVGPTGRSDDRAGSSPVVVSLEWTSAGQGEIGQTVETAISSLVTVRAIGVRLTLAGPVSSLLAASSAIEANTSTDRPLLSIASASLTRRSDFNAGERFDTAAEPARLVLSINVLDFAAAAETATPGVN
jgi:hypothetical protein